MNDINNLIEEGFSDSFSDGEGDIVIEICEGSTPYKKVKMDSKENSKRKTRTSSENASDTMDSEVSHPLKAEKGNETIKDLVKQIRKKKKDKLNGTPTNNKESSESKEKKKKSKQNEDKEKKKDITKKKNKEGDKATTEEKKKQKEKEKEKEKALEAYQKKFQEFEKKYPKYVYKDKIKFPVDDTLFRLYDSLLGKYVPKVKKPVPKNRLIPANEFGDILQIWDLFHSYKELFSLKNIKQEEIYAGLKYQGNQHFYMLDYLHQELLIFFITDFIESYRFESFKEAMENPFFVLVKYYVGSENSQSKELMLIWPEFLKRLVEIQPYSECLGPTAKKYIEYVAELTALHYNKADYKIKLRVLLELINLAYETDTLRYYVNVRLDKYNALFSDRANLLSEIRSKQQECVELKAKIETVEKKQKEIEAKGEEQILEPEDIQKQISLEKEIKELQKVRASLEKVNASIEEKQKLVQEINNSPNFQLKTSARLGFDANKSEYWIFKEHPERLYIKMTPFLYTEDNWRYYDEKEELDVLLNALNVKGIKEKELSEKLKKAISKGELALKSRNPENKDGSEAATNINEDPKEQDLSYWYIKVLEYSSLVDHAKEENIPGQKDYEDKEEDEVPVKTQKRRFYDMKYLTIKGIKEILEQTEEKLTLYLEKWNGRWAHPNIRDDLRRRLREAQDIKDLTKLLMELNQHFEFAEVPVRQKGLEDHDDEEDHSEDDEDEDDEEEDRHLSESEDKRSLEEENSPNQIDIKTPKGSKTISRMEKEEEKDNTDKQLENEIDNVSEEKYKKMSLKIWNRFNERIKLCWTAFLNEINNITCLFLATSIFNQFVETYVAKKNAKYFLDYSNIVDYIIAKRTRKRNEVSDRLRRNRKTQDKSLEKLHQDRELRKQAYNFREDSESDTTESPIKNRQLRNKDGDHKNRKDRDRKVRKTNNQDSYNGSDEEAELRHQRRSSRNTRRVRMIEESEDEEEYKEEEEEEEKECCICQRPDELIECTICENSYHSRCAGLKEIPEDKWTCLMCLEKLASQRHTRSTTRKLH